MSLFRRHPHVQAAAVPAGMGPDAYGSAPIVPNRPFGTRGAVLAHGDDLVVSRPIRKSHGLGPGAELQLRNGRATVSATGRVLPPGQDPREFLLQRKASPQTTRVLPGDRLLVPPAPTQVQAWTEAGSGQVPGSIGGNATLVGGYDSLIVGGAY